MRCKQGWMAVARGRRGLKSLLLPLLQGLHLLRLGTWLSTVSLAREQQSLHIPVHLKDGVLWGYETSSLHCPAGEKSQGQAALCGAWQRCALLGLIFHHRAPQGLTAGAGVRQQHSNKRRDAGWPRSFPRGRLDVQPHPPPPLASEDCLGGPLGSDFMVFISAGIRQNQAMDLGQGLAPAEPGGFVTGPHALGTHPSVRPPSGAVVPRDSAGSSPFPAIVHGGRGLAQPQRWAVFLSW